MNPRRRLGRGSSGVGTALAAALLGFALGAVPAAVAADAAPPPGREARPAPPLSSAPLSSAQPPSALSSAPLSSTQPPSARASSAPRLPQEGSPPASRWKVQASAVGAWSLPVGLEGDRGDVEVRRAGFDVLTTYEVSSRLSVGFDVGAERSTYRFSDRDRVVAGVGRLFEEGTTAYVTPGFKVTLDDNWSYGAAVTVATGFAPGADPADGTTASVMATVRRRLSPSLALMVGGLYATNIEDDPLIVPIVVVLGAGDGPGGPVRFEFRGAGVRAAYPLSPRVSVAAAVRYMNRGFRMASDDRLSEGVFRDVRVPLSVEFDLHPTRSVTISGAVGVNAYADLRFEDRRGNEVVEAQADVGFWFALSATFRF